MNNYLGYAIDTLEIEQSHLKRLMRETEPQNTSRDFKHQINVLSKAIKVLKEYQVVFPNEDPDKEEWAEQLTKRITMTTAGHNLEEESFLPSTDPLADPDVEAFLNVVYGLFVPIITFAVQILNDRQRETQGDARVIEIQVQTIRRAMHKAQSVLDDLDRLAKSSNLLLEPIWPVGQHGVSMTVEEQARYIELVNIIGEAFKDIDDACIQLLSFSLLKKKTKALEIEINRLQSILDKVYISKTYGEKLRYMRWSINICHNVLMSLE